jgi:hypothetical protein
MAVQVEDRIIERGLTRFNSEADAIYICSAQPSSYQDATVNYALGVFLSSVNVLFSPPIPVQGGRAVTSLPGSGTVQKTGFASRWAAVDTINGRLLASGTIAGGGFAVKVGQRFNISSINLSMFRSLVSPGLKILQAAGISAGAPGMTSPQFVYGARNLLPASLAITPAAMAAPLLKTNLAVASLVDAAPILGAPALGMNHVLVPSALIDSPPVFGPSLFSARRVLSASGLSNSPPVMSAPVVSQLMGLSVGSLVGNPPVLDVAPVFSTTTARVLTAISLALPAPVIPGAVLVSTTGQPSGAFADQSNNQFVIEWDATPSVSPADIVTGLSNGVPTVFSSFACIARFSTAGVIDCRNGGFYGATNSFPFSANVAYHFRMLVDMVAKTYSCFAKAPSGSEVQIATNFAFRTEQASIATLNYLGKIESVGTVSIFNMIPPVPLTLPPQVINSSTSMATTGSTWVANNTIATVQALYSPTSWAITAGNTNGYYSIDNTGKIKITSAGISGRAGQTGVDNLTVRATNAYGNSTGTFTINYSPASSTVMPLSKSDSRFASNVAMVGNTPNFGTVANKNWDESPGYTNGGATWGWNPQTATGTLNIKQCIMDGREGVSIFGGTTNQCIIMFDECFIRVHGYNSDHADGLQGLTTAANGGHATLYVTNSTIQCYNDAEAAAIFGPGNVESDCIFWADGMGGDIVLDNCVFWGGARCMYFYADAGATITMRVRNCFFVPSAGNSNSDQVVDMKSTGGSFTMLEWTNNRFATISNGILTPGAAKTSWTFP